MSKCLWKSVGAALSVLVAAGCGGSTITPPSSMYIEGFDPPPVESGEMVIVSPVIEKIAPGTDVNYCSYLDRRFADQMDVTNFRVFQSKAGHHALVYAAKRSREPGTHVCTDDDMVNTRLIASAGGETVNPETLLHIPDGLTFRIPADSQIMLQTHWINAGTTTIDGQAVAYIRAEPSSPARQSLDLFNVFATSFMIPQGQKAMKETTCTIKRDLTLFSMTGHEHEWGSRVEIELIDNGNKNMLWAYDWRPEYQSNPPAHYFPVAKPLTLKAGQQLKVTCYWNNTTDKDLGFPREMCVASGFYYPSNGEIDCDEGVWSE